MLTHVKQLSSAFPAFFGRYCRTACYTMQLMSAEQEIRRRIAEKGPITFGEFMEVRLPKVAAPAGVCLQEAEEAVAEGG